MTIQIDMTQTPPTLADRFASLPFAELEPGHSFFVPFEMIGYRIMRKVLAMANQRWIGREFIARKREEGGVVGMRIWRKVVSDD